MSKTIKKTLSLFLSLLMISTIFSMSTTSFARTIPVIKENETNILPSIKDENAFAKLDVPSGNKDVVFYFTKQLPVHSKFTVHIHATDASNTSEIVCGDDYESESITLNKKYVIPLRLREGYKYEMSFILNDLSQNPVSSDDMDIASNGIIFQVVPHTNHLWTLKEIQRATPKKNGKKIYKCEYFSDCTAQHVVKIPAASNIYIEYKNNAYTGNVINPAISVYNADGTLVLNKEYRVKYYKCKAIGTHYCDVTFDSAKYTGSQRVYFNIVPQAPKNVKLAKSNGKVKVSWNKVTGATKYRVDYSTNSNFKNKKSIYTTNKSLTFNKYSKKTKYYVKVYAIKSGPHSFTSSRSDIKTIIY